VAAARRWALVPAALSLPSTSANATVKAPRARSTCALTSTLTRPLASPVVYVAARSPRSVARKGAPIKATSACSSFGRVPAAGMLKVPRARTVRLRRATWTRIEWSRPSRSPASGSKPSR
jgi:hypothetical protein